MVIHNDESSFLKVDGAGGVVIHGPSTEGVALDGCGTDNTALDGPGIKGAASDWPGTDDVALIGPEDVVSDGHDTKGVTPAWHWT